MWTKSIAPLLSREIPKKTAAVSVFIHAPQTFAYLATIAFGKRQAAVSDIWNPGYVASSLLDRRRRQKQTGGRAGEKNVVSEPNPCISFVVPCYKLGHLLGDCLTSILRQSHSNLEVLVMDDCSPDDTPAVVARFPDPRLTHIRNEQNVGNLRNYNTGIQLARGKYVWLISADDVLRDGQVVARFVDVLERHPDAGYVFCPAVRFNAQGDFAIYGSHGPRDRVFDGRRFLRRFLVHGNSVPAAAGMVRKTCYEELGSFPLDMPFAGDWYMWSLFALHFDVAYLSQPMVGYRAHDGNMTLDFKRRPAALVDDMLRVLWRMKAEAERQGHRALARHYLQALAGEYASRAIDSREHRYRLSLEELDHSLTRHACPYRDRAHIQSRVYAALGDSEYESGNLRRAAEHYAASLKLRPGSLRTWTKSLLGRCGPSGRRIRAALIEFRDAMRQAALSMGETIKRDFARLTTTLPR